uniref:SGNH_hydro domain-containing protein n=1 Tax=Ascaris lumbricoides TaxID=6252 RepID=A0A0M3ICE9_ASCLU
MSAPFAPSLFIFFFHLINNWPKFALFIFDHSLRNEIQRLEIIWSRPRVQGSFPYNDAFVNTPEEFINSYHRVTLSVCDSIPLQFNSTSIIFRWTFENDLQHFQHPSPQCRINWTAPIQGVYSVTVSGQIESDSSLTLTGSATININDRWIVAIGDSFASGEGNPDIPTSSPKTKFAQWISERCHRSARSWAFKVYEKIRDSTSTDVALHFTYLPCTGASVDNGIVASTTGTSQLDIVRQIAQIRKSGPDLVLMSAGGNDIGYSEILSTLIWGESNSLFASVDMRFFYASYQLDRIAATLQKIKPNQVVIPHYFDVTRNERGIIDADCAELRQISTENLILAEKKILQRMNKLISKKSHEYGWLPIERIVDIFHSRGLCSSRPLIRFLNF